jgi:hypothetical protein
MIDRLLAGRILVTVGLLGVMAGLSGIVLGQLLISSAGDALRDSLVLTSETVDALHDAILVAEETVGLVEGGLVQAEGTVGELAGTVTDGAVLLRSTADLTEGQLAESLAAFEASLPGLIDVAEVIDGSLSALAALPFGPSYDPEEPFDDSLRDLQESLAGVPEDLRAQAILIRATAANLDQVGADTTEISEDIGAIREGMGEAVVVLRRSTDTAVDARTLVADTEESIGAQLLMGRLLVILLGLTAAAAQVVPLALGWVLLRPAGERVLLRD